MKADVLILLEGTYPYVRGGVSSWVHQLLRELSEYRFALVFIGSRRADYQGIQYEIPDNVVSLEEYYLYDANPGRQPKRREGDAEALVACEHFHDYFKQPASAQTSQMQQLLGLICDDSPAISLEDFLYSHGAWNYITRAYEASAPDKSFLNYFWMIRSVHTPIFFLADIAKRLPRARLIHSVSTGFAGLLGVMTKYRQPDSRYLISEHGIYTKERKIDLANANWIADQHAEQEAFLTDESSQLRRFWMSYFESLGRMAYDSADAITALYEKNRQKQIADGAPPELTSCLPNGVDPAKFSASLAARSEQIPAVVGLIGRVVPIKDIKTFIRAMHTVCARMPEAEGWIIGPQEEDALYHQDCVELIRHLELEDRVKFLGFQSMTDILPEIGVLALTSISEAQPLVLLEAFAAGVPCVATDVGSCREIIEGADAEDRALGSAGQVTSIANPGATAEACLQLLTDPERWRSAQAAGLQRVNRYYTNELMVQRLRKLYQGLIS